MTERIERLSCAINSASTLEALAVETNIPVGKVIDDGQQTRNDGVQAVA